MFSCADDPVSLQRPIALFFFFNDTATTEIYTLSLHDALPISCSREPARSWSPTMGAAAGPARAASAPWSATRSEEHTSELQSLAYLVCRLLLEKKKTRNRNYKITRRDVRHMHVQEDQAEQSDG